MTTKLSLRLPSGIEVIFEGDEQTFERFREFLIQELPSVLEGLGSPSSRLFRVRNEPGEPDVGDPQERDEDAGQWPDMGSVAQRLEEVDARTDIERIAVMVFAAEEAGMGGLDAKTADQWYRELALPLPGLWRSTFANARRRGYVKAGGQGKWQTTHAGQNFARLGQRRAPPQRPRRKTGAK